MPDKDLHSAAPASVVAYDEWRVCGRSDTRGSWEGKWRRDEGRKFASRTEARDYMRSRRPSGGVR